MSTKARTGSKGTQHEALPPCGQPTLADVTDERARELASLFDPLRERLDATKSTDSVWLGLCREVARGYKIIFLPKEDMSTLTRWVKSYHSPIAAGYRRKVNGTEPIEDLLPSVADPLLYTLLSTAESGRTRAQCTEGAAKWLREVIIERDTTKLRHLIQFIEEVFPPSLKLHENMKWEEIQNCVKESRCYFAQLVHEAFEDFLPDHGKLPGKLELREIVEKRNGGTRTHTSQWSDTLKKLGLRGLPRGTRGTIRRRK